MGRITIMQSSDLKGMAIAAQLSMTYHGSSRPSYIDEETAMPSAEGSQILRAVADRAAGPPIVAVTSLTGVPQHLVIECFLGTGVSSPMTVELAAGQTIVAQSCENQTFQVSDFGAAWTDARGGPDRAVGVSLTSDATPGSFAAFGLAPHKKGNDRYFSAVNFTDPEMISSPNTIFSGVPVGSPSLLPEGKYVPQMAVTNFSARSLRVQVQYAQTTGDTPTAQKIRDFTLPARSTKQLTLDNLHGGAGLQNSLVIDFDGAPGDLMAKLVSTSESAFFEVEILAKDEKSGNGGSHPWSLEQGNDATLLLFNSAPESQAFTVLISGGDVFWEKTYELASMQTQHISIRNLILERVQDDKGKTLPEDSQSGLVEWFSGANGKGRLLESNKESAMARNFSCTGYYCLCNPQFLPGATSFLISSTVGFGSDEADICQSPVPGPCCNKGSVAQHNTSSASHSWSSNNTSIIQISGSSTGSSVNTYGAGGGNTNVEGDMTYSGCTVSIAPPGTVRVPYSTRLVSTAWSRPMSCQAGYAGWDRGIYEKVVDQFGQDFTFDGVSMTESLSIGRNDLGLTCDNCSGQENTYGGGTFDDRFSYCTNLCPASTGETDVTQVLFYNGIPLHNTNLVVEKCSSITWNSQ